MLVLISAHFIDFSAILCILLADVFEKGLPASDGLLRPPHGEASRPQAGGLTVQHNEHITLAVMYTGQGFKSIAQ
jgi:hypothetical protein